MLAAQILALLSVWICLAVSVLHVRVLVLPGYGWGLRVLASAHGCCFVAAAIYATCVERYTRGVPLDVSAHYLLPVHVLFGVGLLSVGVALAMHSGRKRLHWSQLPNLACALVLYGFSCLAITHDAL